MSSRINTKVLIVGGGPVGLTLAIDLAQRGIDAAVAEIRAGGEVPGVRCNHVAARTMEIFRRLGFVQAVRNAGLPPDYPDDVASAPPQLGWSFRASRSRAVPSATSRRVARTLWWPTPNLRIASTKFTSNRYCLRTLQPRSESAC